MKMKNFFFVILFFYSISSLIAQDREYLSDRKNFDNYYYSPLKISRDHPLHSSLFQIPLLSARSLEDDTMVLGSSFEYASIESDYNNTTFSYDFEGGLFRLNFDLQISIREMLDILVRYNVGGVDGDTFSAVDGSNILRTDLKKAGSGNIDLMAKQKVYTFQDTGIDLGIVIGCSIPVVSTKTLAASRNFDFGGGLLATYQQDLFALHFNLGFVYMDDSTAFTKNTEFNISVYSGISAIGKIVNKWYGIIQLSAQNPALKSELSPDNVVGDVNLGVRYVYNSYISEFWIGHGLGDASHGVNFGFSLSLSF